MSRVIRSHPIPCPVLIQEPIKEYAAVPLRRVKLPSAVLLLLGLEDNATPKEAATAPAAPPTVAAAVHPEAPGTALMETEDAPTTAPAAAPAPTIAFPVLDEAAIGKMKVSELRAELSQRGMDSTGLKAELVKRLKASFGR